MCGGCGLECAKLAANELVSVKISSGISSHGTRSSQVSISSHDRYPPNSSSLNSSSFIVSSSILITKGEHVCMDAEKVEQYV